MRTCQIVPRVLQLHLAAMRAVSSTEIGAISSAVIIVVIVVVVVIIIIITSISIIIIIVVVRWAKHSH